MVDSAKVAHSAEEAMEMIQEGSFQVAVVDLHMARMAGMEFCRKVRVEEIKHAAAVRALSVGVGRRGRGEGRPMEDDEEESDDNGDLGEDKEEEDEGLASIKLLLHTTSAGSVRSDELEVRKKVSKYSKYMNMFVQQLRCRRKSVFTGQQYLDSGFHLTSAVLHNKNKTRLAHLQFLLGE